MPGKTKDVQISSGLLSKTYAAELAGISRPIMIKLCDSKDIPVYKPIGVKEWKVSALDLMLYMIKNEVPFPMELAKAAVNYAHSMQPGHLTYAREIFRTFGISPKERKEIPFVPDNPPAQFDHHGNLIVVDSELSTT